MATGFNLHNTTQYSTNVTLHSQYMSGTNPLIQPMAYCKSFIYYPEGIVVTARFGIRWKIAFPIEAQSSPSPNAGAISLTLMFNSNKHNQAHSNPSSYYTNWGYYRKACSWQNMADSSSGATTSSVRYMTFLKSCTHTPYHSFWTPNTTAPASADPDSTHSADFNSSIIPYGQQVYIRIAHEDWNGKDGSNVTPGDLMNLVETHSGSTAATLNYRGKRIGLGVCWITKPMQNLAQVRIYVSGGWKYYAAGIYINSSTGWRAAIPHVYNGSAWKTLPDTTVGSAGIAYS